MLNSHSFFKEDNYIETQNEKVKKPNGLFFFFFEMSWIMGRQRFIFTTTGRRKAFLFGNPGGLKMILYLYNFNIIKEIRL